MPFDIGAIYLTHGIPRLPIEIFIPPFVSLYLKTHTPKTFSPLKSCFFKAKNASSGSSLLNKHPLYTSPKWWCFGRCDVTFRCFSSCFPLLRKHRCGWRAQLGLSQQNNEGAGSGESAPCMFESNNTSSTSPRCLKNTPLCFVSVLSGQFTLRSTTLSPFC